MNGISQAILSIYPKTEVQSCIIHQIRNYIASRDSKAFMSDLKLIYKADTRAMAEMELDNLQTKWADKYPIVVDSWRRNWDQLYIYFDYTKPIRKLI